MVLLQSGQHLVIVLDLWSFTYPQLATNREFTRAAIAARGRRLWFAIPSGQARMITQNNSSLAYA